MRRPLVVFAALALASPLPCSAQSDEPDVLTGPVTKISSPSAFDLAGRHISLGPGAQLCTRSSGSQTTREEKCKPSASFTAADLFLGERLELSGNDHPLNHSFAAYKITVLPPPANVSGMAIIDLLPPTDAARPTEHLIRADGYLLRITPDTKLKFAAPLNSLTDISTNQWIQYSGKVQSDGTVLLKSAGIQPNSISRTEDKILNKSDYDPSKVPDDAHRNLWKEAFVGVDIKNIPPYHDAAMQARVERVGSSLVPAYQRALPDTDPTKIKFRFQMVDQKRWHDAYSTPAGVILVPYQLVERMQNDDQLATVLADNIAEVLEKDALRIRPLAMESLAGTAVELATSSLPLAAGMASSAGALGISSHAQHVLDLELAQSGRVSLCLLHDAGYNIQQAPLAWWLLTGKKDKPLDETDLPPRAETLYDSLGLVWRNPAMNTPPSPPASTSVTAVSAPPVASQN